MRYIQEQVRLLELGAQANEKNGNDVLASWMRESRKHFQKVAQDLDKSLNMMDDSRVDLMDTRCTRQYRDNYRHDWYEMVECNLDSFTCA